MDREERLQAMAATLLAALKDLEWAARGVDYMEDEYAAELATARKAIAEAEAWRGE